MTYEVHVVVRGIDSADEDYLEQLTLGMEAVGAIDPAIVYYPQDNEIGMVFQIEEATLGGLANALGDRAAA